MTGAWHRFCAAPGWILPEPRIELPNKPEIAPDLPGRRRERLPELRKDARIRFVPVCEIHGHPLTATRRSGRRLASSATSARRTSSPSTTSRSTSQVGGLEGATPYRGRRWSGAEREGQRCDPETMLAATSRCPSPWRRPLPGRPRGRERSARSGARTSLGPA